MRTERVFLGYVLGCWTVELSAAGSRISQTGPFWGIKFGPILSSPSLNHLRNHLWRYEGTSLSENPVYPTTFLWFVGGRITEEIPIQRNITQAMQKITATGFYLT